MPTAEPRRWEGTCPRQGSLPRLDETPPLHVLELEGLGVRNLGRDGSDILILAGPVTAADGPSRVYRRQPSIAGTTQTAQLSAPVAAGATSIQKVFASSRAAANAGSLSSTTARTAAGYPGQGHCGLVPMTDHAGAK